MTTSTIVSVLPTEVEWQYGESSEAFINRLSAVTEECLSLKIRRDFIYALTDMNDESASNLLTKIKSLNIVKVIIWLAKTLPFSPLRTQRYDQLCQALSTISSLTSANLHFENDARVCSIAIFNLPHLKYLGIWSGSADDATSRYEDPQKYQEEPFDESPPDGEAMVTLLDDEHLHEIAIGLARLRLENLDLHTHSNYHHVLLPALHQITTLQCVDVVFNFDCHFNYDPDIPSRANITGLTKFIGSVSPFYVNIKRLILGEEEEAYHRFCQAVRLAKVKGIRIDSRIFYTRFAEDHSDLLLTALLQSQVQMFNFVRLLKCEPCPSSNQNGLLGGAAATYVKASIEYFNCTPSLQQANVILDQLARFCPLLKTLEVRSRAISVKEPFLDQKLACLIETKAHLEAITYENRFSEHRPVPLLLKQLERNYTVKHFDFTDTTFDADYAQSIRSLVAMNNAGRAYFLTDPNNRRQGVAVLAQGNDSVAGSFYHLRENPLLCRREHVGSDSQPVYKRQACLKRKRSDK